MIAILLKEKVMNYLKWVSFVLLICGILLLNHLLLQNETSWIPVSLPFPGKGLTLSYPFYLNESGKFVLELNTPIVIGKDKISMSDLPPISCDLVVKVLGENSFSSEDTIKKFTYSGRMDAAGLDCYNSPPISFPKRGNYTIIIASNSTVEEFANTGAMIALSRSENPVNRILSYKIFKLLSYILIVISLFGLIYSTLCTSPASLKNRAT